MHNTKYLKGHKRIFLPIWSKRDQVRFFFSLQFSFPLKRTRVRPMESRVVFFTNNSISHRCTYFSNSVHISVSYGIYHTDKSLLLVSHVSYSVERQELWPGIYMNYGLPLFCQICSPYKKKVYLSLVVMNAFFKREL